MFTKSVFITSLLLVSSFAMATPSLQHAFVAKYPGTASTELNSCATCHMPAKDGFLNPYGSALVKAKMDFAAIEAADSDGDGKTNIDEIKAGTNPGSQADKTELFVFVSKMAPVTFDHAKHVVDPKMGINGSCAVCHGGDKAHFEKFYDAKVVVKDLAHAICIECHKSSGNASAPTKCLDCHKKPAVE